MRVFLDSCILFGAVEDRRLERLLHRCKNLGFQLHTSVSVIGETFALCLEEHRREELHEIVDICEALDIKYGHGWHDFDIIYRDVVGKVSDQRIHPNDYIHLAHACYIQADIFLTMDVPIHVSTRVNEMIRVMYPDELRAELAKG